MPLLPTPGSGPGFLPIFESIVLSVQEKKQKIDFQDCGNGGHLGFPIRKIELFLINKSSR